MASELQIKANRLNAQKSTGPKTAEGKAVVAQNAVKHGLFAQQNVIHCENQCDFDPFRADLLIDLAPAGGAEEMLAERIVSLSWRLKRVERMHSEAIDVLIARAETDYWQNNRREDARKAHDPRAGGLELILGWATVHDFSESHVLERLLDYERRIESSLYKAMGELKKLQRIRKAEQGDDSSTISKASGFEAVTHRGRDARATGERRECAKQSQSTRATLSVRRLPDRAAVGWEDEESLAKEDFEGESVRTSRENKANSVGGVSAVLDAG